MSDYKKPAMVIRGKGRGLVAEHEIVTMHGRGYTRRNVPRHRRLLEAGPLGGYCQSLIPGWDVSGMAWWNTARRVSCDIMGF